MFYSPSVRGFFSDEINSNKPSDCVPISSEFYLELLAGQSAGRVIEPGPGGTPVLVDPQRAPDPDVASVTMRQARLALLSIGKLDDVESAINALPEPHRASAQIEWGYAASVEKSSPLIQSLAPQIGITESDLTDLFNAAALL